MGPKIFKDLSLLGTYHGAPPLLHPSNSVCIVSSKRIDIEDTLPPSEASLISDVQLVTEPPSHEPLMNSLTPLAQDFTSPQGHILIWETVPQAITQILLFYPPPGVQDFQVAAMLTLPNVVLEIPVWYLHLPEMVPQPSFPLQTEGIPMHITILTPTIPPTPPLTNLPTTARGR
jgi:hypothetical protein